MVCSSALLSKLSSIQWRSASCSPRRTRPCSRRCITRDSDHAADDPDDDTANDLAHGESDRAADRESEHAAHSSTLHVLHRKDKVHDDFAGFGAGLEFLLEKHPEWRRRGRGCLRLVVHDSVEVRDQRQILFFATRPTGHRPFHIARLAG